MKLTPPTRRKRTPGRRSRLKTMVVLGSAVLGFAGLALQAGPASADPTQVFVAVGSDTTENVMDQFAIDAAGNTLGSWDAVNPVTQAIGENITPAKATGNTPCSFTRPDGSGQGLAALRKSINPSTTAAQLAAPPQAGCVDIARSSSGPGTNQSNTGALVYIPFALDAVTGATGPTTGTGATEITTADSFTLADLVNLYKNCTNVTEGGVTYNPNAATGTQVQINLYVPQPGSGTLSFWASTLGFSATTLPSCVHQTILAGANSGSLVEENDGTAVASDVNGYMPFSIAQWISQRNGHSDRRHGAVEHNIGGASPFTPAGNSTSGSLNSAFPITREVYNIVSYNEVLSGNAAFNQSLAALLVGTNSALCQDLIQIIQYGFAPLGSGTTDQCGSIANSLRAFDPTTNPV